MKRSDFKEIKEVHFETCEIIVESEGNCESVKCKECPFADIGKSCSSSGYSGSRIPVGEKDKTLLNSAKEFLNFRDEELTNIVTVVDGNFAELDKNEYITSGGVKTKLVYFNDCEHSDSLMILAMLDGETYYKFLDIYLDDIEYLKSEMSNIGLELNLISSTKEINNSNFSEFLESASMFWRGECDKPFGKWIGNCNKWYSVGEIEKIHGVKFNIGL